MEFPTVARQILTVRALTLYIKGLLERDPELAAVWVRGELSNCKIYPGSGHMYFTLKDEASAINGVMWRSEVQKLRFRPQDGMQVLVWGNIGVYETAGRYQLYAREMEPAGVGALYLQLEELKQKLAAEGLFAPERKRPLPYLPRRVGVVTSPAGAAVRDIIIVCRRRWPGVRIVLAPAVVQGAEAPASIVAALALVAQVPEVDVIICGRGGGSLEELWGFNDERVVRAIAACPMPVISAVGHETDTTLADFAADRRAATPSNAAELAVPEAAALRGALADYRLRLGQALRRRIGVERGRVDVLLRRATLARPQARVAQGRLRVDELSHRLGLAVRRRVQREQGRLQRAAAALEAMSPLAVLGRGYAIAFKGGHVLKEAGTASPGDSIRVRLHQGQLTARVESVEPEG